MSFTLPMKYPARLEDGEIVDAEGRRQFLDQKRVVEVINELHEWRMGLKSIRTEVEQSSDAKAALLYMAARFNDAAVHNYGTPHGKSMAAAYRIASEACRLEAEDPKRVRSPRGTS